MAVHKEGDTTGRREVIRPNNPAPIIRTEDEGLAGWASLVVGKAEGRDIVEAG